MKKLLSSLLKSGMVILLSIDGLYMLFIWTLSGFLPFSLLNNKTTKHNLPNGAVIKVVSIKQYGFRSDGYTNTAFYKDRVERFKG